MSEFNYFEVVALYHKFVCDQLIQGIKLTQAEAIVFDNYWMYPESEYELNNFIILVESIIYQFSHNKSVNPVSLKIFNEMKSSINDFGEKLSSQERGLFFDSIKTVEKIMS